MVPKSVSPTSWRRRGRPGTDQGPLWTSGTVMTEQTVAWRWARSVPPSDCARATVVDTTLWEDPVSTTKLRRGATGEADGHAQRDIPRDGRHRQGHGGPLSPGQRRGRRAQRTGVGRGPAQRCALCSRQHERVAGEVDPDRAEAPEHVGAEQARRLPLPADLRQRRRSQLLRREADTVERPGADGNRSSGTGAADAGEQAGRAGRGQVETPAEAGVDGRLPRPRVEDEGERALAVDADVDGLGDLAGHRADGERHPLEPAGQGRRPGAPGVGGRQRERHLRLHVHGRLPGAD